MMSTRTICHLHTICRDQEVVLANQMRCGQLIQTLDATLWGALGSRPSAEQLATLVGGGATAAALRAVVHKGAIAREQLLQSQMRLVMRAARELHFSMDVEIQDLVMVRTCTLDPSAECIRVAKDLRDHADSVGKFMFG